MLHTKKRQEAPKSPRSNIAALILAVAVALSAGVLAAGYGFLPQSAGASRAAPAAKENRNGTDYSAAADKPEAAGLELYRGKPEDTRKFEARHMLPGDRLTRYFSVKARHDAGLALFFKASVTEETKALGSALHIRVVRLDTGKVLFDAPFSDIDGKAISETLPGNAQGESTARYQIDVSMDTAAGNDCQAALLKADFVWYVEDGGALKPPPTGVSTGAVLWAVLGLSSFLLIILLLLARGREGKPHAKTE